MGSCEAMVPVNFSMPRTRGVACSVLSHPSWPDVVPRGDDMGSRAWVVPGTQQSKVE